MPVYRIGCAGWSYREWAGPIYASGTPQERWLEAYASLFPVVEINTTFYGLPTAAAVQRWLRNVKRRQDFTFIPKLWRQASHQGLAEGRAEEALRSVNAFVDRVVRPLEAAGRLEAILVQLPPSFALHRRLGGDEALPDLVRILNALEPGRHRVAVEFRNPSWYEPESDRLQPGVVEPLRRLGVACVRGDKGGARFTESRTTDWSYFRLHERHDDRPEDPGDVVPILDDPDAAASMINAWTRQDERTLVILTHHDDGRSAFNAAGLMERLGLARPRLPATPPGKARLDAFGVS